MSNLHKLKTLSITVEKLIPASTAEVYGAWLDPNCPGSPWNGVTKVILDPSVDGLFYRMHPSEDGQYELAHYGRFVSLDRDRLIRHTWVSQHTRGLESLVTVRFEAQSDQTLVKILHENLPDDEMGRMHKQGWGYYLRALEGTFAQRGTI